MTNFERISKYVYRRYNKYLIKQQHKTLAVTDTPDEAIIKKEQLIREGVIQPKLPGVQGKPYELRYISCIRSGNYQINKFVDGRLACFGTFKCLSDAIDERDYLESIGWDYDNME